MISIEIRIGGNNDRAQLQAHLGRDLRHLPPASLSFAHQQPSPVQTQAARPIRSLVWAGVAALLWTALPNGQPVDAAVVPTTAISPSPSPTNLGIHFATGQKLIRTVDALERYQWRQEARAPELVFDDYAATLVQAQLTELDWQDQTPYEAAPWRRPMLAMPDHYSDPTVAAHSVQTTQWSATAQDTHWVVTEVETGSTPDNSYVEGAVQPLSEGVELRDADKAVTEEVLVEEGPTPAHAVEVEVTSSPVRHPTDGLPSANLPSEAVVVAGESVKMTTPNTTDDAVVVQHVVVEAEAVEIASIVRSAHEQLLAGDASTVVMQLLPVRDQLDHDGLHLLGSALLLSENAEDARAIYQTILWRTPDDRRAWLGMAVALEAQQQWEGARWAWQELLRLATDAPSAQLARERMAALAT